RARDLLASGLAGLQGRVEQGHYVQGGARRYLLQRGPPGVDRIDDGRERAQEQVFLAHAEHRLSRGEEAVTNEAANDPAVAADPVLAPARAGVWPIAVPDAGEQDEGLAGRDAPSVAGNLEHPLARRDVQ